MKYKIICITLYALLGIAPTVLMFATHDFMCKYDMNPLCFAVCVLPATLCLPILALDDQDAWK